MIITFLLLLCISCSHFLCKNNKNVTDPTTGYQYEVPLQTGDGWETAAPASVGMDETLLVSLMNLLSKIDDHNLHSILIIRDGKLIFEEYFRGKMFNLAQETGLWGFDMNDKHNLCSATKSFTSALIGIAKDMGFIQSVDQKVFDFFPEHSFLIEYEPEKQNMTLEHLLTMTSGLEWDDESMPYSNPLNDLRQMFNCGNPMRFILAKNLVETPGAVFDYSNCNTNVLGEIVRKASGQRIDAFSEDYLFTPLGITDFEWQMISDDVVFTSGDLRLRPRDMAKFGYLFLNGGMWNNVRIISQEWIDISTQIQINLNTSPYDGWMDGYGYQWWQWEKIFGEDYNAYTASGWGGQWIIVNPDMNTVVVSTGGNYYTDEILPVQRILVDYIIPSITGNM